MDSYGIFTHISQDYFFGTREIICCPNDKLQRNPWRTMERWENRLYQSTQITDNTDNITTTKQITIKPFTYFMNIVTSSIFL